MSEKAMAGDGPAIEARGLVKVYDATRALDGIGLTVRRGQVFGFLGPNGAGKTTTIRILATLARPDNRDRGHHPGVRAAHPPPLQHARLTCRPLRQCRQHHGAAPP